MHLLLAAAILAGFRVDTGPYTGAYRVAQGGAINWYFATTSLLRLRRLPVPQTRAYLDAYLDHLDPNNGISDVLPQTDGRFEIIAPDSEDAYAATLLSLAARYRSESGDGAWWDRRVDTLAAIAYAKLLTKVKSNGLIRASTTDATGYLMDNVEDYAGLRAFSDALRATHHSDARYYASFTGPLGAAIHHLFDTTANAFLWSDSDPLGALTAYPACIAQVFPDMYDVTSGRRSDDVRHKSAARAIIARCHLSLVASPHEALMYASYIARLHDPSESERDFLRAAREEQAMNDDIVTTSLRDALR